LFQDYLLDKKRKAGQLYRQKEPQMTIAIAFKCIDGIVLCADSYEGDGVNKRFVPKIWTHQVGTSWGVAVASAGEADLADTFTNELPEVLGDGEFDRPSVLSKIRGAIAEIRSSYPDSQLSMLLGLFSKQSATRPVPTCELFRNMDRSYHLGPVAQFEAIGIGGHLSHFLVRNIHKRGMFMEEAIRLGIFAIARTKDYVEGCDGPIQVVTHERGGAFWSWSARAEVDGIEALYRKEDLQKAINDYWGGVRRSTSQKSESEQ